ncbi:MAG: hypothetical protein ACTSUG_04570 [Candidatus Helarchaeota archaeon]
MVTRFIPKLIQNVSLTLGISDDEYEVLKNCSNGENTISDIVALTNFDWNLVVEILKKYEKKGWIKIEYEGDTPEFQPLSIKKFPETAVRLGMISKKKYDINLLCDGTRTVKEISDEVNIDYEEVIDILEDMKKNKIVEIYPKIPLKEITPEIKKETEKKIIQPVCIKNISFFSNLPDDIKNILQNCDGQKTIEDIYLATKLPISKVLKTIIEYEEKGWITLKLDQYMKLVELKNKIKNVQDDNQIKKEYENIFGKLKEGIEEEKAVAPEEFLDKFGGKDMIRVRIKSELPKLPTPVINIILDKIFQLPNPKDRDLLLNKILASENAYKFKFGSTSQVQIHQDQITVPPIPQEPLKQDIPQEIPEIPTEPIPLEEQAPTDDRLTMVLNIINELSQRILNSIISLIDVEGNGTILYQTHDWDFQSDIAKFILDWQSSSPSIQLSGIKYATIKVKPNDLFIATNVQGYGHILAQYLNPLTILLIKMPREQDPLDVEDQLPEFIAKINSIFSN